MRKAVVTGLAAAVVALGLVLGLPGAAKESSSSGADPMMINRAAPVCIPIC